MSAVLQLTATVGVSFSAGLTRYYQMGVGPQLGPAVVTESLVHLRYRTPGVLSGLYFRVLTNDRGGSTVRVRKNGANGNQVLPIPASMSGEFQDTSNTDAVASGDNCNYEVTIGSGGSTFTANALGTVFEAETGTVARLVTSGSSAFGSFLAVAGLYISDSTEARAQIKVPACTIRHGQIVVESNGRNGDVEYILRKNGVDTDLVITVPAATSGLFENTADAVAFADGDLANWRVAIGGTSGSGGIRMLACDAVAAADLTPLAAHRTDTNLGFGQTRYSSVMGVLGLASTESDAQAKALLPATYRRMGCFVQANNVNGPSTIRFRRGGADAQQLVTIPASASGRFDDTDNEDLVGEDDLLSLQLVTGGTSGSLFVLRTVDFQGRAVVEEETGWLIVSGGHLQHPRTVTAGTGFALVTQIGRTVAQNRKDPPTGAHAPVFATNATTRSVAGSSLFRRKTVL